MTFGRRAWHIETRFGRFYVVDQFGGFAGWHGTREEAEQQAAAYVAQGDRMEDQI